MKAILNRVRRIGERISQAVDTGSSTGPTSTTCNASMGSHYDFGSITNSNQNPKINNAVNRDALKGEVSFLCAVRSHADKPKQNLLRSKIAAGVQLFHETVTGYVISDGG